LAYDVMIVQHCVYVWLVLFCIVVVFDLIFVFFFKQKTAYEMPK